MKDQDVNGEDWDYLIILDACRYDAFEKIYSKFFGGELEKRYSKGSSTTGWLEKAFPGKYDYTYVSGNPFVNSHGYSLSDVSTGYYSNWRATEHFERIVDSWRMDWDHELETVTPERMTKRAIRSLDDKRMVIHYMQPHRPYLEGEVEIENMGLERATSKLKEDRGLLDKIRGEAQSVLYHLWKRLGVSAKYRLKKLFGQSAKTEKFIMEDGAEKIVEYYMKNLELVLKWVDKLLPYLEGKVVITSDHGEAFGEEGLWWHEYREEARILHEVPWFRVDMSEYEDGEGDVDVEDVEEKESKEEDIKKKLEKLGYA